MCCIYSLPPQNPTNQKTTTKPKPNKRPQKIQPGQEHHRAWRKPGPLGQRLKPVSVQERAKGAAIFMQFIPCFSVFFFSFSFIFFKCSFVNHSCQIPKKRENKSAILHKAERYFQIVTYTIPTDYYDWEMKILIFFLIFTERTIV